MGSNILRGSSDATIHKCKLQGHQKGCAVTQFSVSFPGGYLGVRGGVWRGEGGGARCSG